MLNSGIVKMQGIPQTHVVANTCLIIRGGGGGNSILWKNFINFIFETYKIKNCFKNQISFGQMTKFE